MNFIVGIILSIMIASVGVSGVAQIADSSIDKVKTIVKEGAK